MRLLKKTNKPNDRHNMKTTMYQPKTGAACHCKRGVQRDNCPSCEGTGMQINFAAIRLRNTLRHHVTGAIERGEAVAIAGQTA